MGILNLQFEGSGNALWIPKDSPFWADSKWIKENFHVDKPRRIHSLIIEGNVRPFKIVIVSKNLKNGYVCLNVSTV